MSESRHLQTIESFRRLVTFDEGYGDAYSPADARIEVEALKEACAEAERKMQVTTLVRTTEMVRLRNLQPRCSN